MKKDPIVVGGSSGALAIGAALSLMHAARRHSRTVAVIPPTKEELAARAKRDELREWNAAVEARKAEKLARKQMRGA